MATQQTLVSLDLRQFENYRKAEDKVSSLQEQRAALSARIAELDQKLSSDRNLDAEAAALLDSEDNGLVKLSLAEERRTGRQRLRVLEKAIELGKRQLGGIRTTCSQKIAEKVRPEYAACLREVAKSAVALAEASEKEREFRENLIDRDIAFTGVLPPVGAAFQDIGRLSDPQSQISRFLGELKEHYGINGGRNGSHKDTTRP